MKKRKFLLMATLTCSILSGCYDVPKRCVHEFGDYIIVKEATCTEEGEEYRVCKLCNEEERETIAKIPHSFGPLVKGDESNAFIDTETCSVCGYVKYHDEDKIILTDLQNVYSIQETYVLTWLRRIDKKITDRGSSSTGYKWDIKDNAAEAKLQWVDNNLTLFAEKEGTCQIKISFKDESNPRLSLSTDYLTFTFVNSATNTVLFYDGDEEVNRLENKKIGDSITFPILSTRENEVFLGWVSSKNDGTLYKNGGEEAFVKKGINIFYAFYTTEKYTDGLQFSYQKDEDYYAVTGYNGVTRDIEIPGVYDGKPVFSIAADAFKSRDIHTVKLPNTIKKICQSAFEGSNIVSLDMPSNSLLKTIFAYAFRNCLDLEKMDLSKCLGLETIGNQCFRNNSSLLYVHLPSTVKEIGVSCFANDTNAIVLFTSLDKSSTTTSKNWSGGEYEDGYTNGIVGFYTNVKEVRENNDYRYYITNDGFVGIMKYLSATSTLKEIVLDQIDGYPIQTVCNKAFQNSDIKSVELGSNVENIDYRAFENCTSLEIFDAQNNDSLKTIENYAFNNCKNLLYVYIPSTIKSIGGYCFQYDTKCTVMFECLNATGISLGEKWNGYDASSEVLQQKSNSIKRTIYNVSYWSYDAKTKQLSYTTNDGTVVTNR